MPAAPVQPRRSLWTWCRISVRWLRITSLLVVLMILGGLCWLRWWGLPDFLHQRIVAELAKRGVSAQFASLRFHWFRGLVASDLRVAWGGPGGPRLAIAEADLDLAPPPWRETKDLVRGLAIRDGELVFPLPLTNEPSAEIRIEHVAADVRFPPDDAWIVRRLAARAFGLQLELTGSITNVSTATRPRPTRPTADRAQSLRLLRRWIEEVARWSGPTPPRLAVQLSLDAAKPDLAYGDMYFEVPRLATPQGDIRGLRLSIRVPDPIGLGSGTNRAVVTFDLDGIDSGHGGLEQAAGRLELAGPPRPALPDHAAWHATVSHLFLRDLRAQGLEIQGRHAFDSNLDATSLPNLASLWLNSVVRVRTARAEAVEIQGRRCAVDGVDFEVSARHRPRAEPPDSVNFTLATGPLSGSPGSTGPVRLSGSAERRPESTAAVPPDLSWWKHAWPYNATIRLAVTNLVSPKLNVPELAADLRWNPPLLEIERLQSRLYSGELNARGSLDAVSRETRLDAETTFDLHGIDALLGPRSRENFVRYQWARPPWFKGSARVVLPAWTDRRPDWERAVKPTVRLDGRFRVEGGGGFKGVQFDRAESSLRFDGANWRLPDMVTQRPEGTQKVSVDYNEDTRAYRVDASGPIFPQAIRPLIGEKTAEILDLFDFPVPVDATVSVWGPWSEGTSQSIVGSIQATNYMFRSQRFDRLDAQVVYTNRFLAAAPVRIQRDAGVLTSEGAGYDFDREQLWLTNTVNTIVPSVVAAAISPGFPEKLVHYRFDEPPTVRVDGTLQPRRPGSALMNFAVEGGPFHFWRFSAEKVKSRLLWRGDTLTLTNIQAAFYGGSLDGEAFFDLADPQDSPYRFTSRVRGARLEDMLTEATRGKTNVARGEFDLDLHVRSARTSDLWTWNGDGRAELRDGLLWDAPIFGFLSPVLNSVVPGLGNNRAKNATASFAITNGVFHTRDLDISCPPAKLLYRGSIDLDQRVHAKVEGQILGDFPGFGPLFGLLLRPITKLMEFRVTGTLSDVEAEPIYVPKFILLPLQPFKAIRSIFKSPESHPRPAPPADVPAGASESVPNPGNPPPHTNALGIPPP